MASLQMTRNKRNGFVLIQKGTADKTRGRPRPRPLALRSSQKGKRVANNCNQCNKCHNRDPGQARREQGQGGQLLGPFTSSETPAGTHGARLFSFKSSQQLVLGSGTGASPRQKNRLLLPHQPAGADSRRRRRRGRGRTPEGRRATHRPCLPGVLAPR